MTGIGSPSPEEVAFLISAEGGRHQNNKTGRRAHWGNVLAEAGEMVMPAFQKFRDEAAIIGRLLAGYGELEIGLFNCVMVATGNFDATLKAMFRARGEKQRTEIADGLGRRYIAAWD